MNARRLLAAVQVPREQPAGKESLQRASEVPVSAFSSSSRGAAQAAEEEAEASAAPAPAEVRQPLTAVQRPASLVLEQLPVVQSDGSFSSTTFAPDRRFGHRDSWCSQDLENTEEANVEAALTLSSGQEDFSATKESTHTVLQQPEAAAAAAPSALDDKISSALAKAEKTARTRVVVEENLARVSNWALEKPLSEALTSALKCYESQLVLLARRQKEEHLELQELLAESKAGTKEQLNTG